MHRVVCEPTDRCHDPLCRSDGISAASSSNTSRRNLRSTLPCAALLSVGMKNLDPAHFQNLSARAASPWHLSRSLAAQPLTPGQSRSTLAASLRVVVLCVRVSSPLAQRLHTSLAITSAVLLGSTRRALARWPSLSPNICAPLALTVYVQYDHSPPGAGRRVAGGALCLLSTSLVDTM